MRLRLQPAECLVTVAWGRAHIYAAEADEGRASVSLWLVNMLSRPIKVERLNFEQFLLGGVNATVAAPLFTPPRELVPALGIQELHFNLALGAPAIRQLGQRIQKSPNAYSSPLIDLTCAGSIDLLKRRKSIRVPFSVVLRNPEIHLSGRAAPEEQ